MARAESSSPWPLVVTGGAVAAGALWWWQARRANAAPAAVPSDPIAPFTPAQVAGAPLPPLIPASVVDAMPPSESAAPVALPPPARPRPIAAPSSPGAVVVRLPFVPPALAAAVDAAAAASARPTVIAPPVPAVTTLPPVAAVAVEPAPVGWVWPLLRWQGYTPDISDGWGSKRDGGARRHHGADLMYPRRSRTDRVAEFPPRGPHSPGHFMPAGTLVVAVADGEIWEARRTSRGYAVTLTHAGGWVTFYQHLARLFVPQLDHGTGRVRVRAGQALGIVGADPTQGPNAIAHLHFELRQGVTPRDPRPSLQRWRVLDAPLVLPEIGAVVAAPRPLRDPREVALLERIYREHGRGLPVAYLAALGRAESGGDAHHPQGVLNITRVALDEYNRRHPNTPIAVVSLRDPVVAVTVASWILREVIASYRTHHPDVPNLREAWGNPEFVALLTAGWNAGYSERSGVGRVVDWLVAHGLPVTLANVFGCAKQAHAAPTLRDTNKRRFAERVTKDYQATAGGAS